MMDGSESWTAWVADPSWGPADVHENPGAPMNAFNGLEDFGTFVQKWLAGGTASRDGGAEQ